MAKWWQRGDQKPKHRVLLMSHREIVSIRDRTVALKQQGPSETQRSLLKWPITRDPGGFAFSKFQYRD